MKDGITSVESLLQKFNITVDEHSTGLSSFISSKVTNYLKRSTSAAVNQDVYIENDYQNNLIQEMIQTAAVTDFCLIGPRGCGKNILVSKMAEILGKETESIILYQDMTSRDLVQQRTTLDNGDTVWRFSPLVNAALEGKIAILDGIHRIHPSTLSVLHR